MQYCSLGYLLFLPAVIILYHLFPKGKRWLVLLAASYFFFFTLSGKLLIYLLLSTLCIYIVGIRLEKLQLKRNEQLKEVERKQRKEIKQTYKKKQLRYVKLTVFLHIGLLVLLKYSKFIVENLNIVFKNYDITLPIFKFLIPIGISFYSLSAISYIIDIYHEKIKADHQLSRLALFMSFFPQIMEGPIVRYEQTAFDLYEGNDLEFKNLKYGALRIGYGFIKKLVVADRLNSMIKLIYTNYATYDGGIMFLGMVFYTIQLYCDFSGTMDMVIGTSEMFGITMPENFKRPFFSKSISEFWSRWHITLGTWFKDYIYYPMSLSKGLRNMTKKARKRLGNYYGPLISGTIALFCVWLCNGLWHGAAWGYIFFGLYHFVFILTANLLHPVINKFYSISHIDKDSKIMIFIRTVKTVLIVCVGELFFRAESLTTGINMFKIMITQFTLKSYYTGLIFKLGMDRHDYLIVFITLIIVFIVSSLQEKNIDICASIEAKPIVIRWSFYYAIILFIIIFGAYGDGYVPVDPLYANF